MSQAGSARILYVEDDEGLARLFTRKLEKEGYHVSHAPTGAGGLEMLEEGTYDVLALDYMMPGMSGLDVLRSLAADGTMPPVIMITGAGDERVAIEAMKLGASDYVVKDVDGAYLELLPTVVEQALVRRRLELEKEKAEREVRKAHDELERRVEQRTAELENALEELKKSEQRFRTVFLSATDCIFMKDADLRYTSANPCMVSILGVSENGILGKTDRDFFNEEAAEHLEDVEARVMKGEIIEEEHTRTVNGFPYTFLDTRVPITDGIGHVTGILGISRNITDRKRVTPGQEVHAAEYPSQAMRSTMDAARLAAQTDSIVLLNGESGVGKDFLARFIHDHSRRSAGSYFAVNCAAIAAEIAESELFGHEAGAFTGASRRKKGLFELAEGGTLLLNEIGEISAALQSKLLTFLDTRSFTRVGGEQSITVNARLIVATNRDLKAEVAAGRFREDLYYRINVLSIRVPSLRERADDIPVLVRSLLADLCAEMQLPEIVDVRSDAMEALYRYSWPGNVRELRNVLERALILSQGSSLTLEMLGLDQKEIGEWHWSVRFPPKKSMNEALKNLKVALIQEALHRSKGKRTDAAKMLGMSRDALKKQMKTLGLMSSNRKTA